MNTEAGQCEYSAVSQQGHRESCCDGQKSVTIQTPPDTPLLGKDPERDTDGGDGQDDYWGETTTAVTSERSTSMEDLALRRGSTGQQKNLANSRTKLGFYVSCVVAVCALLTPPAFITIPLLLWGPELDPCGTPCEGLYISVAFKLLLVVLASWAVFLRSPRYVMPRLVEFRALVVLLLFLFIASYWLFYGVRILGPHEKNLLGVVQYAASLVDALIFIHYLAVVLLEIRQLQPFFSLKVVRSSDGEARFYNIGILSIQRTALFVLENYYKDFPMFNHEAPVTKKTRKQDQHSVLKMYNVDGPDDSSIRQPQSIVPASASYKDRYYEEAEYSRKVRRRRARLVMAVEEAFSQLQSMAGKTEDSRASHVLNPREAAQSIFPLIAQSLQRYLRTTQQSHLHSMEGIVHHLTFCLSQGMSPQAFLEQYLRPGPPQQYPTAPVGLWTLVSEESVTCPVRSGLAFSLYTLDTRLVVSVNEIPVLRLNETFIPPNSHRFTIRDRPESIL